jgi:hypothetical protein
VRRDLWVGKCRLRPEAGLIADTDFFLRLAALSDALGLAQPLAIVRVHPDSVTAQVESLALQLAADYLFQSRYNATSPSALDKGSIDRIHRLASSFTTQLLIEALQRARPDWIRRAKAIRAELDSYVPDQLWREMPTRHRIIWALALHDRVDLLSHVLRIIRNSGRPILRNSRTTNHRS